MKLYTSPVLFLSVGLLTGISGASTVDAAAEPKKPENLASLVESISSVAASKGIADVGDAGRRFLQMGQRPYTPSGDTGTMVGGIMDAMQDLTGGGKRIASEDGAVDPANYGGPRPGYTTPQVPAAPAPSYPAPSYPKSGANAGCSCSKEFMQRVRNDYRDSVNGLMLSLSVFCDQGPGRHLEGIEDGGEVEEQSNRRDQVAGDAVETLSPSYMCPTYQYPIPEVIQHVLEYKRELHEKAVAYLAKMDCSGCVDKHSGYVESYKSSEIETYDCCCDADSIKDIVENFFLGTVSQMAIYFISPYIFKSTVESLFETADKALDTIIAPYHHYGY